jgi:hypothetical protein
MPLTFGNHHREPLRSGYNRAHPWTDCHFTQSVSNTGEALVPMRNRYLLEFKRYLLRNWRWFVLGIGLGVLVFIAALIQGYVSRISNMGQVSVLPGLTVVAIPTDTPPDPTSQATQASTATQSPTLPPSTGGEIEVGEWVIVAGTEGDRLRIRTQPGLSSGVEFLAYENDVFQVEGGPEDRDGYVWWFLVNPYDSSISGWAVENYLRRMENP